MAFQYAAPRPKDTIRPAAPIIELGQCEELNVRHLVAWEDKTGMGASMLLCTVISHRVTHSGGRFLLRWLFSSIASMQTQFAADLTAGSDVASQWNDGLDERAKTWVRHDVPCKKELQPHLAPCSVFLDFSAFNRTGKKDVLVVRYISKTSSPFSHLFLVLPFADFERQ